MPTASYAEILFSPDLMDMIFGETPEFYGDNEENFILELFTRHELNRLAILLLTVNQFKVYFFILQGYTQEDIATILGITQQAVSQRFNNIKEKFRKHYGIKE